jgi:hypothetical protein
MNSKKGLSNNSWTSWGLLIISSLACLGAILRVSIPDEGIQKRLDEKTLLYLGAAGVLLLLKDVKNIAFGDYKVEFFEKKIEEAKIAATVAIDEIKYNLEGRVEKTSEDAFEIPEISPGNYKDDPWKGQFGDKAENVHCRLTAKVIPASNSSEWFYINLRVESTNPQFYPLKGYVKFYLHPTFVNNKPLVPVVNGVAQLSLRAWGAFTVGAITMEKVMMELDLAKLKDPELAVFVSR